MGFEDLEHKIEDFLNQEGMSIDMQQKARIKELVFLKYSTKKDPLLKVIFPFLFNKKYSTLAISAISFALLIGFIPVFNNQIYAGEIYSEEGLVEITRNGKKMILKGKSKIKVGDEIFIKNNASAKLHLRNNFKSEIFENSQVKIAGKDDLFLVQGQLNNHFQKGKILTNKGEISTINPSVVTVDVTKSGETRIMPQKNSVLVKDWQGEEISLTAGEELRLRTDTSLAMNLLPKDLELSDTQIQAIRSKLFISRTKALNYVENRMANELEQASNDLDSAEKTFKSIAQVLKSSRDMQALLPRENINMLDFEEIYKRLSKKTNDSNLLAEVKSVEALLELVKNRKNYNLSVPTTDVLSFNRYVLVARLFASEPPEKQEFSNILREQYALCFARKIFNEELRIDQISVLNNAVEQLPKSAMSGIFLKQVKELLTPELEELLTEKIKKEF